MTRISLGSVIFLLLLSFVSIGAETLEVQENGTVPVDDIVPIPVAAETLEFLEKNTSLPSEIDNPSSPVSSSSSDVSNNSSSVENTEEPLVDQEVHSPGNTSRSNESDVSNIVKVNCLTNRTYDSVEIVNATRLMELLKIDSGAPSNRSKSEKASKQIPAQCVVVFFYARWCVFSSQAAPHFNALPKFFPDLKAVAIDAIKHQSFNTQYGIVGVPTLMLVHNGKPVAKFNDTSYTLESFSRFVTSLTNLQPNGSLYVTSSDFAGPLSSTPSSETDYCLILSWIFVLSCAMYFTSKSRLWKQFVELVQNTWRESNAQHEHEHVD